MRLINPVSQGMSVLAVVSALSGYAAAAITEAVMVVVLEIVIAVAISSGGPAE